MSTITPSDRLVADLLASMRNEKGLIAPVDIAITLLAVNEHAQSHPDKSIGKADLAPSGGATGLLADYVERQLERFSDDERSTVYAMLLELADLDNDRRRPEGLGLDQLAIARAFPVAGLDPEVPQDPGETRRTAVEIAIAVEPGVSRVDEGLRRVRDPRLHEAVEVLAHISGPIKNSGNHVTRPGKSDRITMARTMQST